MSNATKNFYILATSLNILQLFQWSKQKLFSGIYLLARKFFLFSLKLYIQYFRQNE